MATTNITMRMDEDLKSQLQELVSNLGMDMTTFFTISAKQAVREQRIPFAISMDYQHVQQLVYLKIPVLLLHYQNENSHQYLSNEY